MADFTPKPGQGTLFKNKKKEKETHPDMTGYIIVPDGIKPGDTLRIAAWSKTTMNGDKFLSLNAEKQQEQTQQASRPAPLAPASQSNEEFPF